MYSDSQSDSGVVLPPLLTESEFRRLLGGVSERTFKHLRERGVVGEPLDLGPRLARWTHQDYLDAVQRLRRRDKRAEPQTLAAGRRERIERLKAGGKTPSVPEAGQ